MAAQNTSRTFGFWLVAAAFLLRVFVPGNFLDLFYDYDLASTGQALAKIHPGTYALVAVAAVLMPQRRQPDGGVYVTASLILSATAVTCGAWGILFGKAESLGWIVDSELSATAMIFSLSRLPQADRQAMLPVAIAGMSVNCLLSFTEWATHIRIVPYRYANGEGERTFRPTALLNHPLINGLYTAGTIPFIMLLRTPMLVRYGLLALFAAATITAEARFATLAAVPMTMLVFLISTRERGTTFSVARALQIAMGFLFAPLTGILILAFGLGERISNGLIDQSSAARLDIYSMLKYLTPQEFILGVGARRAALILSLRRGLVIESPLVQGIFLLGLPMTILLFVGMLLTIRVLLKGAHLYAWLGAASFLIVAASNNGLVTKTPEVLFLAALIAGSRGRSSGSEPIPAAQGRRSTIGHSRETPEGPLGRPA